MHAIQLFEGSSYITTFSFMIYIHQIHRFFSINEFTTKFIDFIGNPSVFYSMIDIEHTVIFKSTKTSKFNTKLLTEVATFGEVQRSQVWWILDCTDDLPLHSNLKYHSCHSNGSLNTCCTPQICKDDESILDSQTQTPSGSHSSIL